MKTILVTGGCGYLGSQLIRDFATDAAFRGATIRILDNMQQGDYQALMDLPATMRYEFIEGDIIDPAVMRRALVGVDAVVHLAAVVKTPLSFEHPAWTEQVNHWGTARLVEHCLEAGVQRFIFASSASVYGPGGSFRETDECRPIGPYAQSKQLAERSIRIAIARGLRPTILRFATFFGEAPSIRFHTVANRFAYLAGVGKSLTVFGTGDQTRPLIHVLDASAAIRHCLVHESRTDGRVFNAVWQNASIHDIVAAVHAVRPQAPVRYTEQDLLTHFTFLIDGQSLEETGWRPLHDLRSGLAQMIERFSQVVPLVQSQVDWE